MKSVISQKNKRYLSVILIMLFIVTSLFQMPFMTMHTQAVEIDISGVWGAGGTLDISTSGIISLVDASNAWSSLDAGSLILNIRGGAEVYIEGGGLTYTSLAIQISQGAKVTLDNVNIDNTNCCLSPLKAMDGNAIIEQYHNVYSRSQCRRHSIPNH